MRDGARESIGAELRALARGAELPRECPPLDADGARYCARLGVSLHHVLQQYHLGHAIQWEAWFELVEQREPDADERRRLLDRASRFFFDYADRMCGFATEHYTDERERSLRSHEQRRVQLVRELLDARGDVASGDLGYDLDGLEHIGLIAWGAEGSDHVRALSRALDGRLLIVGAAEETWWAWIGAADHAPDVLERALARVRPPAGVRLAIGAPSAGREGFRRTHQHAAAAHRAAPRGGGPVVRYEDIALEALAAADATAAHEFIALELRGIEGADARSARLRETLTAWFACGQNAAATAARLGVHEQTVAQRLRAVEERTGRPVAGRRAELETALRLRRYLGQAPPSG